MAVRIPVQRTDSTEPSEPTTPVRICAVEECEAEGAVRYFPSYRLTLCANHFVRAADKHRSAGRYW